MTASPDEPLSGSDIARVRAVFGEVVDLPPHERNAKLIQACSDKPLLLAAVRELLVAHDTPQAILDSKQGEISRQLFQEVDAPLAIESIGQYKIRSIIGKGGMGIVYLAQQSNPHREVALKIIRSGWNAEVLQSRFEREIRVLGRLKHAGITHIYEAGTADTKDGPVAFFAMEYVHGKPLTDAVNAMSLPFADRVELMAKVADAVQHAHTKAVIHRDLKPANILVSDVLAESVAGDSSIRSRAGGPQPKILDFGVARILDPDTVHTQVTEAGHVIGTINYMSPEQLSGDIDAIDARTDVYALGVILYELISGRLPHELRGKPIAEAARIVRDDPPAPLNSKGSPRCDRDLETIVLHAIDKDRERRYATAAAFAEDLRRYLRNETILARPATTLDQFTKLARRNKGLVVGLAAAMLAITAGMVVSTTMYFKEQKARQRADAKERLNAAFKEYMIDGVLMAASPDRKGWEVKVIDVLGDAAQGVHERFSGEPDIEASLRGELGGVFNQIGRATEAKEQFLTAIPLLEKTYGRDSSEVINAMDSLCAAYQQIPENQAWLDCAKEALQRAERGLPPTDYAYVSAINNLGGALVTAGKFDEARPILARGRTLGETDLARHRNTLANIYNWLTACESATGNVAEALAMRRSNLDFMVRAYGPEHRDTLGARANLITELIKANQPSQAVEFCKGLPEAMDRQFPPGHPLRAQARSVVGVAYTAAGQYEEAETCLLHAYRAQCEIAKDFDWFTEQNIKVLRQLYTRWPGHQEQVKQWCTQSIKARLMLATTGEFANLPGVLNMAVATCEKAGLTVTRAEFIQAVWAARDEFAPAGHRRRSLFYANFYRMAAAESQVEHLQESLDIATESLPYALEAEAPKAIIAAAPANREATPSEPKSK